MPGCPLRRTSTRPLEGALRSKAEGELTLGLMSGENQKQTRFPVGAGLPAKNVWATRSFRQPALSLTSIASKLAPTILNRANPIPYRSRLAAGGVPTIAVGQSTHLLAGRTLSPASRLLQLIGAMANYRVCCCCCCCCLALALALAFDLDLPRRKAEWRFCAVGNPAWMPG